MKGANLLSRANPSKSGLLCLDGAIGQWFPLAHARRLLTDIRLGANASIQIKLLEQSSSLQLKRLDLLKLQIVDSEKIAEVWRKEAQHQAEAYAQRNAWWRSPTLWFAVGLALGVSGVTAAVVAAK